MSRSIKVSPKHGVNPSMLQCPLCGKDTGIAMMGRLHQDKEAPQIQNDLQPCDKCVDNLNHYKEQGFLILVCADGAESLGKDQSPWPYFLRLFVLKPEKAAEIFDLNNYPENYVWMENSTANKIGLTKDRSKEYEEKNQK